MAHALFNNLENNRFSVINIKQKSSAIYSKNGGLHLKIKIKLYGLCGNW